MVLLRPGLCAFILHTLRPKFDYVLDVGQTYGQNLPDKGLGGMRLTEPS